MSITYNPKEKQSKANKVLYLPIKNCSNKTSHSILNLDLQEILRKPMQPQPQIEEAFKSQSAQSIFNNNIINNPYENDLINDTTDKYASKDIIDTVLPSKQNLIIQTKQKMLDSHAKLNNTHSNHNHKLHKQYKSLIVRNDIKSYDKTSKTNNKATSRIIIPKRNKEKFKEASTSISLLRDNRKKTFNKIPSGMDYQPQQYAKMSSRTLYPHLKQIVFPDKIEDNLKKKMLKGNKIYVLSASASLSKLKFKTKCEFKNLQLFNEKPKKSLKKNITFVLKNKLNTHPTVYQEFLNKNLCENNHKSLQSSRNNHKTIAMLLNQDLLF